MLIKGILNPQINALLARVRHTNMLVIADRGFPFWPMIETVDISLVDDIPTVLQVFQRKDWPSFVRLPGTTSGSGSSRASASMKRRSRRR